MGVRCAEYLKRCRASRSLAKTGFFWRLFGALVALLGVIFLAFFVYVFLYRFFLDFWRALEGFWRGLERFWEGLGGVLGGFWEGFFDVSFIFFENDDFIKNSVFPRKNHYF